MSGRVSRPGIRFEGSAGLFGPVLEQCIDRLNQARGTRLKVATIRNDAFGADLINVAGLVHGSDIVNQCSGRDLGDFLILPHVMLKDVIDDPVLVDDYGPRKLRKALGVPIVGSGNTAAELFELLADWQDYQLGLDHALAV